MLSHPNRLKLEMTFQEMGDLADNSGFDVTVILAPTAVRLQGKYFDGFPKVSTAPYFLEFVTSLAEKEHFKVIDLYSELKPLADHKLLYFRDDDHWNEDGHSVVATILAKKLAKWSTSQPAGQ